MYVKQVDKNTYQRDWKKELSEVVFLIGIGALVIADVIIGVLIFKTF